MSADFVSAGGAVFLESGDSFLVSVFGSVDDFDSEEDLASDEEDLRLSLTYQPDPLKMMPAA